METLETIITLTLIIIILIPPLYFIYEALLLFDVAGINEKGKKVENYYYISGGVLFGLIMFVPIFVVIYFINDVEFILRKLDIQIYPLEFAYFLVCIIYFSVGTILLIIRTFVLKAQGRSNELWEGKAIQVFLQLIGFGASVLGIISFYLEYIK